MAGPHPARQHQPGRAVPGRERGSGIAARRPWRSSSRSLPPLPDSREVRIATAGELVEAGKDPVYDLDPEFIDFSLGKGDLCAGVFEDDRLLAYYWRATGPTPHLDGIWVEPGSGYCYSYKAFTHPACRQQGLQEHVARFTDAVLSQRGFTDSIGFVDTHNFPSIKASLKRGSQKVGYAGYVRAFGKILPFRTPGAKRHGFRFFLSSGERAAP